MLQVEMLPARNGDALWVEYGDPDQPHRLLIDCGRSTTVEALAEHIRVAGGQPHFDLFVMTHIDADHIEGALQLLADDDFEATFGDIWFNGWRQIHRFLSVRQGDEFSKLLTDHELPWNQAFWTRDKMTRPPVVIPRRGALPTHELPGRATLTLLSPTTAELARLAIEWRRSRNLSRRPQMLGGRRQPPEAPCAPTLDLDELAAAPLHRDSSAANGSSIAFLAEFGEHAEHAVLFTGDAHVDVLTNSIRRLLRDRQIERLRVDALKLSHHGSQHALSKPLLDLVECRNYLVSTNGEQHYHPDREAIARVILWGGEEPTLHFNYRTEYNGYWDDPTLIERYGYRTRYPDIRDGGLTVTIA